MVELKGDLRESKMERTLLKNHFSNPASHFAHPYGQAPNFAYGQMPNFAAPKNFTQPQPQPQDLQTLISNAVAAQRSSSSSATIMQEMNRSKDRHEQTRTAIRLSQNSADSSDTEHNSPEKKIAGLPRKKASTRSTKKKTK